MANRYKICLFYDKNKIVEQDKIFPHHEEALRWLVWKRIQMPTIFGAVIFKYKRYLDYFLAHESWKIFKFAESIERCIVAIEGLPPLISYIDDFENNEMDLMLSDRLGFQLKDMKMVLVYTGNHKRRAAIAYILHEIGHCVFDMETNLGYDSFTLRHELEAWQFAVANAESADIDIDYVRMLAKECLETYIDSKKSIRGTGMPRKNWWAKYKALTKQQNPKKIE